LSSASDPLNSYTTRTAGVDGYGSDILILRYQPVQLNANSSAADGSMIDCNGNTATTAPAARDERMANILSVAISTGEPSLMCATVNAAGTLSVGQPIIRGVENFQVLYGVDGVTLTPNTVFTGTQDSVPDRYLRADQMVVSGDAVGTNANWRRVRSLRIGMILRGPSNSAQNAVAQTLYPFGLAKSSSTGTAGSALSSSADVGTIFAAPADGRLRQVVTFTVHLRNAQ
jgi:type IV pilus assembly protein PilW